MPPSLIRSLIAHELWRGVGLEVVQGDFTRQQPGDRRFNLILTNPPYVRHHHLGGSDKARLQSRLARSPGMKSSGLSGLYCYFLLLSHEWMARRGLAMWLVPSEFMDVNYGAAVRRYLTEHVTLLQIHRFYPADLQFADAQVSSAVVVFRNAAPPEGHRVRFTLGGPIARPQREAEIRLDLLRRAQKWTRFPEYAVLAEEERLSLGDLFSIKRGLATGCNRFFIMDGGSQENRPPAPFLCTYMGRDSRRGQPLRLLWNRSQATAHNVYYLMLYPKGALAAALESSPDLSATVFAALQRISPSEVTAGGRVYGGGLYKVEPKELARIPIGSFLGNIAGASLSPQSSLFG